MFVEMKKAPMQGMIDDTAVSTSGTIMPADTMVFELVEDAKSDVAVGCNRVLLDSGAAGPDSVQGAAIAGEWEIAIDKAGRFQIVRADTSAEGICVTVHDPAGGEPISLDTGRLSIDLASEDMLDVDFARLTDVGPINFGRIDHYTGIVTLTWAVSADSVALAEAGLDPLKAIVPMIGCFDKTSGMLHLSGVGEVLNGPLAGSKLQVTTKQKTTYSLTLDAPDKIKKDANGEYKAKLTVKLKGSPSSDVSVGFRAIFTPPQKTSATFNPATVTLSTSNRKGETEVTLSNVRPIQLARFSTTGGGKPGKDESTVE